MNIGRTHWWGGACVLLMLGACGALPRGEKPPPGAQHGTPLPDAGTVVGAYNTRVRDLDRLRAPITLVIDSPKEGGGGGRSRDQVDGSLQVMLPSSVALRIDKVGQALAYLGSNDDTYWWFDLGDQKRAYVGAHALASPEKARRFGLPVHPLDLMELAGVTPLPNASLLTLAWTNDGLLQVRVPGRWSSRRLVLDPRSYEPTRIEIIDRGGRVAAGANLSRYQRVDVDRLATSPARIAGQVEIEIADADVRASLAIVEPRNPGERLRLKAFDLAAMLDSYNIKDVRDMDAPAVSVPAQSPAEPTAPSGGA